MTTTQEEIYALDKTRQFLRDLLDPQRTPRISKSIRQEASSCLRHHPFECQNEKERVDVSLNLNDEEFLLISKAAHREGMSLNDWVNMALKEVLEGDLDYEYNKNK